MLSRCERGQIPDPDTMKLIVAETEGAVQPNDFYDLPLPGARAA